MLKYNNQNIYFIQYKRNVESSINIQTDRTEGNYVKNKWLGKNIEYKENFLQGAENEFEAKIEMDDMVVWLWGKMSREEFEEILRDIYFY